MSAILSAKPDETEMRAVEKVATHLEDILVQTLGYDFCLHPRLAPAVLISALEKATLRLIPMEMAEQFPGSLERNRAWMRQGLRELLERSRIEDEDRLGIIGNPGGE
jgi:hypothetical protein